MKRKTLKYIFATLFSCILVFSLDSCGNKSKYLKGQSCGSAKVEGTAFNQIRKFYVEKFVYEYNLPLLETEEYASCSEFYDYKYSIDENNQLVSYTEIGTDNWNKGHYLFTYLDNETLVTNYVTGTLCSSNTDLANKYLSLLNVCYNGTETGTRYGYNEKLNTLSEDGKYYQYDADAPEVNGKALTSVQNNLTSHSKACIVFSEGFEDPATFVELPRTTWKSAWDVGLLYGLFVYPMAWLVNIFVKLFSAKNIYSGVAQIAAILVVTIVLKILIFLATFKSQSSTQKMQDVQPEIAKIQAKYGQNPSPEDKQRMSMELMSVYQKYGIKPLAPFASLLITFPVFIAMYRAVMFLGILRKGEIGGVILGNQLSSYIIGGGISGGTRILAIVIFIIMAASQVLSMKLPQIMNKKRMTPEAKQQQKQGQMVSNVMMIMILVMGFLMPVTMSIYWIASALVGIAQSIIMHKLNNANKGGKYKVKKENRPITIPQGYKK